MPDLLIRNGSVVTASGMVNADIAIEDGAISAIGTELYAPGEEIDATGLTILPGLIDIHVHFNEPGRTEWEGAATGSRALAAGGGVLYFDMPLNSSPCTISAVDFDAKRAALEAASTTDFAMWGGLVPGRVRQMAELAERGVIGFKAFLCNSGLAEFPAADDDTLYQGMREAARLGLPVAVHAENDAITGGLARHAQAEGRTGARDYLASRPIAAEVEAIERAGRIARETGAKLHIVHVSCGSSVAAALESRAQGTDISIETCAHYLHFTEDDMVRIGAAAKCAPPLRSAAERESLWDRLTRGDIDAVASDHSPAPPEMKTGGDFFAIWGGIAGVQFTLAVLLQRADLPVERIALLTSAFAARRFQLPNRGEIAVGHDADLALINLNESISVDAASLFQRHKITPYLGQSFRGCVRRTILRGRTIFHDGQHFPGAGRLIRPAQRT
ncbi:MAG: allantoinase AllB [Acidobacteria bacterium]|nr:allantoinase AllB [Acidobacteriota bacterium]